MKTYLDKITLNKNGRGCYIPDTVKGCWVCGTEKPRGCYGNCYALQIARRYKFDFARTVERSFEKDCDQLYLFDTSDQEHIGQIIHQLKNIDMPFVRIGEMGDPSYGWEHTVNVCEIISIAKVPIVIATKHWETISDELLQRLGKLDICINTSISALDNEREIKHRLEQYERIKSYCHSVLRVVTCDFNLQNKEGVEKARLQNELLAKNSTLETVFRPDKDNLYIRSELILAERVEFLGSTVLASMRDKTTFFGYCKDCPDMCGISLC